MSAQWKDNGGPAFPQLEVVAGDRDGHGDMLDAYTTASGGMSLRDWLAGQNMAAMIGASFADYVGDEMMLNKDTRDVFFKSLALMALTAADAMIAARDRP